jgi:hypothetical protein
MKAQPRATKGIEGNFSRRKGSFLLLMDGIGELVYGKEMIESNNVVCCVLAG